MEHVSRFSFLFITLLRFSRTEITNSLPESWYSANVINDGNYSPKPLTEIFSTLPTFPSTTPAIVLPPSTLSSLINTASTSTPLSGQSTVSTTLSAVTGTPNDSVIPLKLNSTNSNPQTTTKPVPTSILLNLQSQSISPQPASIQPQKQIIQLQSQPIQFQQQPLQPQTQFQPQPIQPESTQQAQTGPQTIPSRLPPNFVPFYQQPPQQNDLPGLQKTPMAQPNRTLAAVTAPCLNTTGPNPVPKTNSPFSSFRVRMISPIGTITTVRINPSSTTRRPASTRTRKTRRNNYDECIRTCTERRDPICAGPLSASPINPDTLKGFPSICHMACHNSFKKNPYEKLLDGRCGRLRTRIRPFNSADKLKRDELNKAQYTVVQSGPQTIIEFSPISR